MPVHRALQVRPVSPGLWEEPEVPVLLVLLVRSVLLETTVSPDHKDSPECLGLLVLTALQAIPELKELQELLDLVAPPAEQDLKDNKGLKVLRDQRASLDLLVHLDQLEIQGCRERRVHWDQPELPDLRDQRVELELVDNREHLETRDLSGSLDQLDQPDPLVLQAQLELKVPRAARDLQGPLAQ